MIPSFDEIHITTSSPILEKDVLPQINEAKVHQIFLNTGSTEGSDPIPDEHHVNESMDGCDFVNDICCQLPPALQRFLSGAMPSVIIHQATPHVPSNNLLHG
jgi:hypothetical protein